MLLGDNHWINDTAVTWISDTALSVVVPAGSGIQNVVVYIDNQPSVPQSTTASLQYTPPFIDSAAVGLQGGK